MFENIVMYDVKLIPLNVKKSNTKSIEGSIKCEAYERRQMSIYLNSIALLIIFMPTRLL